MADQNAVPIPQGAQIGEDTPQAVPIPQGAQVEQEQPQDDYLTKTENAIGKGANVLGNVAAGFGKGFESTAAGIGGLIHRIPGVGETLVPQEGLTAQREQAKPQGIAQGIGYGGETLTEFLLGDEAFKGLGMADRLLQSGKIAKVLESSPRLIQMLKMGANVGKAASQLGPEEQAILKQYPIIARLVHAGLEAPRVAAVQAAQTGVRESADTSKPVGEVAKEAAQQGAETGATAGVLGGGAGVLQGALSKSGEAGLTLLNLAEKGGKAPDKADVVKGVRDLITSQEQALHGQYEKGVQDLSKSLQGQTVPIKGSPLQKAAKTALGIEAAGTKLPKDISSKLAGIVPGTERVEPILKTLAEPETTETVQMSPDEFLKKVGAEEGILKTDADKETVKSLVEAYKNKEPVSNLTITQDADGNLVQGEGEQSGIQGRHRALAAKQAGLKKIPVDVTSRTSDLDIDGLIDLRQSLGQKARELQYGDPNSRKLRKLIGGIDDTIDLMADKAEDPQAAQAYRDLRNNYKQQIQYFESTPIDKLRTTEPGKQVDDIGHYLTTGGNSKAKVDALRQVLGNQRMDAVAEHIFNTWLGEATEQNGAFKADKLLRQWNKIPDDTKNALFQGTVANDLSNIVTDAKSARQVQALQKAGLIYGAASTFGLGHTGLGILLGTLATGAEHGSGSMREAAKSVLDYVVNNPTVLKGTVKAAKVAESPAIQQAARGAAQAVTQPSVSNTPTPQDMLRSVYQGTQQQLGGNQQ